MPITFATKLYAMLSSAMLLFVVTAMLPAAVLAADDDATIELGKTKFGENCSGFCHGAGGKGARAPCLICGSFKRGESDAAIARNISEGIAGTPMGAFGEKLNADEVKAIVAFLRYQQAKKAEAAQ
jgi:mono/diheme cytochrome c family protein